MKEDVKKYLGLKVRAIREAAGMTQEELAATCDVSWRTISNLERGTLILNNRFGGCADRIARFCRCFPGEGVPG